MRAVCNLVRAFEFSQVWRSPGPQQFGLIRSSKKVDLKGLGSRTLKGLASSHIRM